MQDIFNKNKNLCSSTPIRIEKKTIEDVLKKISELICGLMLFY